MPKPLSKPLRRRPTFTSDSSVAEKSNGKEDRDRKSGDSHKAGSLGKASAEIDDLFARLWQADSAGDTELATEILGAFVDLATRAGDEPIRSAIVETLANRYRASSPKRLSWIYQHMAQRERSIPQKSEYFLVAGIVSLVASDTEEATRCFESALFTANTPAGTLSRIESALGKWNLSLEGGVKGRLFSTRLEDEHRDHLVGFFRRGAKNFSPPQSVSDRQLIARLYYLWAQVDKFDHLDSAKDVLVKACLLDGEAQEYFTLLGQLIQLNLSDVSAEQTVGSVADNAMRRSKKIGMEVFDQIASAHGWDGKQAALKLEVLADDLGIAAEAEHVKSPTTSARLEASYRVWEVVLGYDPTHKRALNVLSSMYRDRGAYAKLADVLKVRASLTSNDSDRVGLNSELGTIYQDYIDDPIAAIDAFQKVQQAQPHHQPVLKSLATLYEVTSQWQLCQSVLDDLIMVEANPSERALLFFKHGSISETQFSDADSAVGSYLLALRESSGCLPALHGLRDIYLRSQRWTEAIQTLEKEIDLWTDAKEKAQIYARIARIYGDRIHDFDVALSYYRKAIDEDEGCLPALSAIYEHSLQSNDIETSLAFSDRLIEQFSRIRDRTERAQILDSRLTLLLRKHRVVDALDSARALIEIDPSSHKALDCIVSLYNDDSVVARVATLRDSENGEVDDVSMPVLDYPVFFANLDQTYRQSDQDDLLIKVLIVRARISESAGDLEQSGVFLREAVQREGEDNYVATIEYSRSKLRYGEEEEAIGVLEVALSKRCTITKRFLLLKEYAIQHSDLRIDLKKSLEIIDDARKIRLYDIDIELLYNELLYALGRFKDALAHIERLELDNGVSLSIGDRALLLHRQSVSFIRLGRDREAHDALSLARQMQPGCEEIALSFARYETSVGKRSIGQQILIETSTVSKSLEIRRALVASHIAQAAYGDALAALEDIVKSEQSDIDDLILYAEVLFRVGGEGVKQAIQVLEEIINDRIDPFALSVLQEIHNARGNKSISDRCYLAAKLSGQRFFRDEPDDLSIDSEDEDTAAEINYMRLPQLSHVDEKAFSDMLTLPVYHTSNKNSHVSRVWSVVGNQFCDIFGLSQSIDLYRPESKRLESIFVQAEAYIAHRFGLTVQIYMSKQRGLSRVLTPDKHLHQITLSEELLENTIAQSTRHSQAVLASVLFHCGVSIGFFRQGCASLLLLGDEDISLLVELLDDLLLPKRERRELSNEFMSRIDMEAAEKIHDISRSYSRMLAQRTSTGQEQYESAQRWLSQIRRRGALLGLVTAHDLKASIDAMRIADIGHRLAKANDGLIAEIPYLHELFQYYISSHFEQFSN